MIANRIPHFSFVGAVAASLILGGATVSISRAQDPELKAESELAMVPLIEPSPVALPIAEDRGYADLEQTIKRLGTTASVLVIVAHPDDEDGSLMTYLSRGLGARVTLMTLTRGEGGQNAMSAEEYDALGLIRTNELLKADEYYGASQLWGTEADFGFSKTQEESFAKWGHDRVLYDAVLAVRRVRPQIILSTFVGGVSDGHGHHQVSGEIAQEAFKVAGDPSIFPDQLKNGIEPWQPLAVYSRTPFAPITDKGIFDYATGKWAPARFRNYVTGEWINGALGADATMPVGKWDAALGRTYTQIAREGWGEQKSQYGGANPELSGPETSEYHLWAVVPESATPRDWNGGLSSGSLFDNTKVQIDTHLAGLAGVVKGTPPDWLFDGLRQIDSDMKAYAADCHNLSGVEGAKKLVPAYRETLDLYARARQSNLDPQAKASIEFELASKIREFQTAFKDLLGLDLIGFVTHPGGNGGFGRGNTADESSRSVTPGEHFQVRVHTAQALGQTQLKRVWLESRDGARWSGSNSGGAIDEAAGKAPTDDRTFNVTVSDDAEPTAPYFTRPTTEQPYYDVSDPALRLDSFAPWPLQVWAEFSFDGVPIRLGGVVQTLERVQGPGGIYEPLVVTPAIGVSIEPESRILPLDGSPLPVMITVHAETAADGAVELKLPEGWKSEPAQIEFHLKAHSDSEPLKFEVSTPNIGAGAYSIEAVAQSGGKTYATGWKTIGYQGLRPYNQYKTATLATRKVDVKLAPGLRVGYVMGTGDTVPEAIRELGVEPHLISDAELSSGDLSAWNVIVIGIRAYSNRKVLIAAQPRLDDFVKRGGTLVVQYQGSTFPAPLPVEMGRMPERVVDEQAQVKLLDPDAPLLNWPNKIGAADFDGWVEERGHGFLDHWDAGYTALTETSDPGQDPQRGGLLVAHIGKGTYIYVAYALYRQLTELVPGSYRIMANLLSAHAQ
ncbi:MAG TPA: PIG-L family deacetylase [Terracidiphilus sp.]|nr:PIG-L family deacetylase [Terracidiphilus sp.]